MSEYRVIAMDVDGTLANSKKEMTAKTKEALMQAQRQGIKLILASGRPTTGLLDFAKELEMNKYNGLLVSFNGSKVTDCTSGEVLFNETMTVDQGKAVLEHMKNFDVMPMIDKDNYMYVNDVFNNEINYKGKKLNIIQYESRGGKFKLCEKEDLASFADYPLNKILIAGDPVYLIDNHNKMREPFMNSLNGMFTADFYFEFTALGIDKAKALDTVLSKLGYCKDELIAFGDGHNDKSMLEYAGLGIAMDNAVDELKNIANYVTLSNDEDGIAHAVNKFINKKEVVL